MSTWRGLAVGELAGSGRAEHGRAHVHRRLGHVGPVAAAYSTVRIPAAVATVNAGGVTRPASHGRLGQAADAVAAHLGLDPVGVAELHGEVGTGRPPSDPDHPVGTHPE